MPALIRRGNARFTSRAEGRLTRHTLAFGEHYDPDRVRIGPMICHDTHVLGPGRGFETHPHADVEIVTWVLAGGLDHRDSTGTRHRLEAGSVAVLSAGSGVEHSEVAATGGACRFVQAWLLPDEPGRPPAYRVARADPERLAAGGAAVAVGPGASSPGDALGHGTAGASLTVARLEAGASFELARPAGGGAATRHLYVASGALLRSSMAEPLEAGDALELSGTDPVPVLPVTAAVPTELMLWTFA